MSEIRAPLIVTEPAIEGASALRAPLTALEPVSDGASRLLEALGLLEPVSDGALNLRCAFVMLETVIEVPEEGELATELFPTWLGIAWEASKTPNFNTQVRAAASLRTTRNSLTPYPAWDFELTFPWLPTDRPFRSISDDPDLQVVLGFFLRMGGRARDFLFRDYQDYRVRGGAMGVGDGVTTEFKFLHEIGGYTEPVGQVDLLARFNFAPGDVTAAADSIAHAAHGLATGDGPFFVASTTTIPPGLAAVTPYWAIRLDADTLKLAASHADALAATAIDITGAGAGVHSLTGGWAVYDAGVLVAPADVTFTAPNGFVFDVAPADPDTITADFDFLFVCHFLADAAQFQQFAGDLFNLQQVQFRADPP